MAPQSLISLTPSELQFGAGVSQENASFPQFQSNPIDEINEPDLSSPLIVDPEPSSCSIRHSTSSLYAKGVGSTIQAGSDQFSFLCWLLLSSAFPPTPYYVFGQQFNGQMHYMTYESDSNVLRYRPNTIDPSQIDLESSELDPRLFRYNANNLVVASTSTPRYAVLNHDNYNVETLNDIRNEWQIL